MSTEVPKRSRVKKILLISAGALLALVIIGVLLLPTIASSLAPGIIESQAAKAMKGTVKVKGVSVSWSGPTTIESLEVLDDAGKTVATVRAQSSLGILSALGSLQDLGTLTLSGKAEILSQTLADGGSTCNLMRAVEARPQPATPVSSSSASSGAPQIKAQIDITSIDVAFTQLDAKGAEVAKGQIAGMKGSVAIDTLKASAATGSLDAKLSASVISSGATSPLTIAAKVSDFISPAGAFQFSLAKLDVAADAQKLPVALVDAFSGTPGLLTDALGDTASLKLMAKGSLSNLNADLSLQSANTTADAGLSIVDSRLTLTRPAAVDLASTRFLSRLPQAQKALSDAGASIEAFPSAKLSVTDLRVKLPGPGGAIDLRSSAITANVLIGPASARVRMPEAGSGASTAASVPTRLVQTTPVDIRITSTDLASAVALAMQPVQIRIDSSDAGEITLNATAQSLATDTGAPRAVPGSLNADAVVRSLDLRLVQPFIAAANLPVDLIRDAGPRAEITLNVRTIEGQPGVINSTLALNAERMNINADLRITETSIESPTGATIRVSALAPIINSALNPPDTIAAASNSAATSAAAPPAAQTVRVSGSGPLDISAKFKAARPFALDTLDLTAQAKIGAMTIDVERPNLPAERFDLRPSTFAIVGAPKSDPRVTLDSSIGTRAGDALIKADLTLRGVSPPSNNAPAEPAIYALGTRRVVGNISITDLPTALVSAFMPAAPGKPDLASLLRDSVGPQVNITAAFRTDAKNQVAELAVRSPKLTVDSGATLAPQRVSIAETVATLRADDVTVGALTTYLDLAPSGSDRPRMAQPSTLRLAVSAVTIPTNDAGLNFAGAGDAVATVAISTDSPLIIRALPLGEGRTFDGGLANVRANVAMPVAAIGAAGARGSASPRVKATAGADLVQTGANTSPVASFTAELDSDAAFGDLRAKAQIKGLDTARADQLLNQPGVVSGALGKLAEFELTASPATTSTPNAPASLDIALAIRSDRLVTTPIRITQGADRFELAQPIDLTWTIDPAFANATFLAPKRPAPNTQASATMSLVDPVVIKARMARLALSRADTAADSTAGPFKSGIFAIDLSMEIPSLKLETRQPGAPAAERISLSTITGSVKSEGASVLSTALRVASVDGSPTPISVDAKLANYTSAGGAIDLARATINADVSAPSVPTALIDKLASSGRQLSDLLGTQMSLNVKARDFAPSGGLGVGEGSLNAKFVSVKPQTPAAAPENPGAPANRNNPRQPAQAGAAQPTLEQQALLEIAGPVRSGTLRVQSTAPLNISLAQFDFGSDTKVLGMLPLFAKVRKEAGSSLTPTRPAGLSTPGQPAAVTPPVIDRPLSITSRDLVLPTDGDVSKLNGVLRVDPGRIDYIFKRQLGQYLDSTIFTAPGNDQLPIPAFDITIVNGIATYQDVSLPIRNFTFKAEGRVDLVTSTIDAVIYIPTVAASQSLMSKLNADLGSGFGRILPDVISEGTMVPIRARGPMSDPEYSLDVELFFKNFGKQLNPAKLIDNIGKGIGDLFNRDKDKK
jgi:hypothetical protein